MYMLSILTLGNPDMLIVGTMLGRDRAIWGAGYEFMLRHLDERFGDVSNINSLNIWLAILPMFAESVRSKNFTSRGKIKRSQSKMLIVTLLVSTFVA